MDALNGVGYSVSALTGHNELTYGDISAARTLAIVLPWHEYNSNEVAAIRQFIQGGGRLVVVGEYGAYREYVRDKLNLLLGDLGAGISFNADLVYDFTNNDAGRADWPIVYQFSNDAVNQDVYQVVEYTAGSLSVLDPGYVTAWGDADSYSSIGAAIGVAPDEAEPVLDDPDNPPAIGGGGENLYMMAMARIGAGDLFVIADSNLWSNEDSDGDGVIALNEYDNRQFAINVFTGSAAPGPTPTPATLTPTPTPGTPACAPDSYEPDDNYADAGPCPWTAQEHNFHIANDVDWEGPCRLDAGETIYFWTDDYGAEAQTVLEVVAMDGSILATGLRAVQWTAPQMSLWPYVRARHNYGRGDCDTSYRLYASKGTAPTTPSPQPTCGPYPEPGCATRTPIPTYTPNPYPIGSYPNRVYLPVIMKQAIGSMLSKVR